MRLEASPLGKFLIIKEESVKTLLVIIVVITLFVAATGIAVADSAGPMGPAPNSGDCDPDGSGFESPNGPNSNQVSVPVSMGPAPNSGDGDPDGSGF